MKPVNKNLIAALIVVTAFSAAVLSFRRQPNTAPASSNDPVVMATIFPLYDIVRNVAGDAVSVGLILPSGAEPHTYEPTPSDLLAIGQASVVYAIGHGVDGWLDRLGESAKTPIRVVDDRITLLIIEDDHQHEHENEHEHAAEEQGAEAVSYDPHYWLSADNAAIIAQTVAIDLSQRFPERQEAIQANLNRYLGELSAADLTVRSIIDPISDRKIATFHGAYHYFANAYGLEVVAEFEPFPGKEPSAKYLSDLKTTLASVGVRTIYREPNFNPAAIAVFAQDNGLRLGLLDPLGGTGERDTLINTLLFNANEIARNQR